MKRLPGVIVSGVVLILVCLFQLLLAALVVFAGAATRQRMQAGGLPGAPMAPPVPDWTPLVMYAEGAFFVALAVWGILTAIGLFRTRRWARYSTLVIGGGLVFVGMCMLLATAIMMVFSEVLITRVDPSRAQAVHTGLMAFTATMAAIDVGLLGLGIFWLAYFNLKRVRAYFEDGTGTSATSKRPMLIAVLAVMSLFGAASCLLMAFLPLPGALFGFILHGWGKVVVYLVFGALMGVSGVGLWRLKEWWGRRLAIAMQALGLCQIIIAFFVPERYLRYSAEINARLHVQPAQLEAPMQIVMMRVIYGLSMALFVAILMVLGHYRGAFAASADAEQTATPELPS